MEQRTLHLRVNGVPVFIVKLSLFAFVCLALSPLPLVVLGATQNLERYAVEKLPEDDRALEAWYLENGARWAIAQRIGPSSGASAAEVHVDFRGRGIWRLQQPPLDDLGYGAWHLRGWERKVLPWKTVPPLLLIAAVAWLVVRWTFRATPAATG